MPGRLNQLAQARHPQRPRGTNPGVSQGTAPGAAEPAAAPEPNVERWQRREAALGEKVTAGTATGRQQRRYAQFQAGRNMQERLAEDDPRRHGNPRALFRRSRSDSVDSRWPAARRMQNLETVRDELGYNEPTDQLQTHLTSELAAGSPVDLHAERAPLVGELQQYASERLGTGLTPEEEAAIRGRMKDVTEATSREREMDASRGLAAAGIDPRSGIAASRAGQIANQRAQGLTDIEREITLQDLARKGDIESLATSAGGLGERAREFDVGAEEAASTHDENALYALAGLRENQFQNNLDYSESGRQARAARRAARRAAAELEPGALQYTGTILGALL